MAELRLHQPKLDLKATLVLEEEEVRALDALVGYGDDAFIKAFYEKLGRAYMEKHEEGLRSFLITIRKSAPAVLHDMNRVRDAFSEAGGR